MKIVILRTPSFLSPISKKIFPAFELIKTHGQNEYYPFDSEINDWKVKWRKYGGLLYNGRMIALKDNSIWKKLSKFSKPYPPYDFGSGMSLSNVGNNECETLGLVKQTLAQVLKKRIIRQKIKIRISKKQFSFRAFFLSPKKSFDFKSNSSVTFRFI